MILVPHRFLKNDVKAAGPKISWSVTYVFPDVLIGQYLFYLVQHFSWRRLPYRQI
jgi:hypothetical protein